MELHETNQHWRLEENGRWNTHNQDYTLKLLQHLSALEHPRGKRHALTYEPRPHVKKTCGMPQWWD